MEMLGESSRYIAYIILNECGAVEFCSKPFLERFALSSERILGQKVYEVLQSEELKELLLCYEEERVLEKGERGVERLIPIAVRKRGLIWCMVEAVKENGCLVVYFHDRTESYQAQMILESAMLMQSDVFVFFDTRRCVLQCSEEAVRIFGFPNRVGTFGLHYTTFFHNRIQGGVLQEMFECLESGQRYEGVAMVRYKGEKRAYEARAFNVMMKKRKAGMAIFLKESGEAEPYVAQEDVSALYSGRTPYIVKTREEKFEPYEEMEEEAICKDLYKALLAYKYNESMCMVEYLLCYGGEQEKERYLKVKEYLRAFCYDQAAELVNRK